MDAWLWVCISASISATALAEELFYLRIEGVSRSLRQSTTKESQVFVVVVADHLGRQKRERCYLGRCCCLVTE